MTEQEKLFRAFFILFWIGLVVVVAGIFGSLGSWLAERRWPFTPQVVLARGVLLDLRHHRPADHQAGTGCPLGRSEGLQAPREGVVRGS